MAFNPMQQQQSPDMLMAMMTDPRATPQQRMAAMSALNALKGGANAPQQPPQMTGDSTGVSDMDPAFMAAVRQEMTGQGQEAQPEIAQRQAAPEAPQNPSTEALMSGAADASRVAAMAHGGAVKGYAEGKEVTGGYGKKYKYGPLSVGPFYPQNLPFGLGKLFDDNQDPNEEVDLLAAEDAARVRGRESIANRNKANIEAIKEQLLDSNISDFRKSGLRSRLSVLEQDSKADLRRNTEIPSSFKNTDLYQYFVPQSEKREIKNEQATAVTEQQRLRGELQEPLKLQSIEDLKQNPPLQEFPINADAAEAAAPAAVTDRRANDAKAAAAAQALTTPPPAAVDPGKPDPAAEALNARKQAESDAYKERMDKLLSDDQPLSSQDKWMALARAGFAAAAGSSPYALQNIGAGLSKGAESLDELRKERAINRMKQATLLQSQRSEELSNEARNRQLDISAGGLKVEQGNLALKTAENDPTSPMGKAKLNEIKDRSNLYKAEAAKAGRPDRETDAETLIKAYTKDPDNPAIRALLHLDPKNKSDDQKALDATNRAQSDAKIFGASNTDISPAGIQKVINFQDERENAYRERFGLPVIKFAASAPPKLTSDQQVNYDAAKKAIKEGKDRNAVLERLRASGVPTDGL